MKNLLSIVFLCCTYVSSVMWSSWHFSTSGFNIRFPRTPRKLKRIITNFHQIITSIFYMLLEDSFGVKSISKFSWDLEAYIKNVYDFCWPMYTDLGRPGDTFAVAGFLKVKRSKFVPFFYFRQFSQKLVSNFFSILAWTFPRMVLINYPKLDLIESL